MGTRGAYGFKINNEEKLIYSQYDSGLNYLGKNIVSFLNKPHLDLNRLKQQVEKLQDVSDQESPNMDLEFWKEPSGVLNGIYLGICSQFYNCQKFSEDALFCEYYYLIDLDTNELVIKILGRYLEVGRFNLTSIPSNWHEILEKNIESKEPEKTKFLNRLMLSLKSIK